jgi:NAD(P)-dependent dehydrogenase (short-subunit alcohol dehydrogenase family)
VTLPLDGRTAVVTGASRGIGFAIAAELSSAGARVALLARNSQSLENAASAVGSDALPVVCDVRDPASVARATAAIETQFGDAPHILVCAAGVFTLCPVADTTPDEFADALAANLFGPFLIARAVLPRMLTRRDGHLVLIGSVADRHIFPENGAYSASKYGARALWEILRAELRGSGVRATLVSPGPTDTAMWDPHDPDAREEFVPRAAMLRIESVADAVRYAVTRPAGVLIEELRLSPA